jgi:hypothetical protein
MRFKTASEASSLGSMNGYVSENTVFSFCVRMALVEKNGSMLLGKFMSRDHFTVNCRKLSSREHSRVSQEFI